MPAARRRRCRATARATRATAWLITRVFSWFASAARSRAELGERPRVVDASQLRRDERLPEDGEAAVVLEPDLLGELVRGVGMRLGLRPLPGAQRDVDQAAANGERGDLVAERDGLGEQRLEDRRAPRRAGPGTSAAARAACAGSGSRAGRRRALRARPRARAARSGRDPPRAPTARAARRRRGSGGARRSAPRSRARGGRPRARRPSRAAARPEPSSRWTRLRSASSSTASRLRALGKLERRLEVVRAAREPHEDVGALVAGRQLVEQLSRIAVRARDRARAEVRLGGCELAAAQVVLASRRRELDRELEQLGRRARRASRQRCVRGVVERGGDLEVGTGGGKREMPSRAPPDRRRPPRAGGAGVACCRSALRGDGGREQRMLEPDVVAVTARAGRRRRPRRGSRPRRRRASRTRHGRIREQRDDEQELLHFRRQRGEPHANQLLRALRLELSAARRARARARAHGRDSRDSPRAREARAGAARRHPSCERTMRWIDAAFSGPRRRRSTGERPLELETRPRARRS